MGWQTEIIDSWDCLLKILEVTKCHEAIIPSYTFRGQANANWTLKPSLLRKVEKYNFTSNQIKGIEKQLIFEFKKKYNLYNHRENLMSQTLSNLQWITIMQHYSCPTRFLDWTNSPYIATFFGVESEFDKDGAIFLFDKIRFKEIADRKFPPFEKIQNDTELLVGSDNKVLYEVNTPSPSIRNIIQHGLFTFSPNVLADHETIIDSIMSSENKRYCYGKIIIPMNLKPEFLGRLKSMNISAAFFISRFRWIREKFGSFN